MSSTICKKWKKQFDTALNTYIEDIVNDANANYNKVILRSNNYKVLSQLIKRTGYPNQLENFLIQLKQNGHENCFEYILNEYYVHIFRNAYDEYMNMQNHAGIISHISFEIISRLVKDRLFSPFEFGTKKTMNQTILLQQRELGLNNKSNNKIKKNVNYDCIESIDFLIEFAKKNNRKMITDIYSNKRYNKELIQLLDKHINKVLKKDCLNLLLNIYPYLQKVIDKYNNLDEFLQDSETFLKILKSLF